MGHDPNPGLQHAESAGALASRDAPGDTARRQALRVTRLLIALAVYVACGLLLSLIEWLGYLPGGFAAAWALVFAGVNLGFLALIRSGANLRFRDPSMTMAQMVMAIGAVAGILYAVDAARGALLMLPLVILMFGALRLNTVQLYAMGALSSLSYAAVIVLLSLSRPDRTDFRVEWIQWIALTATLIVVCPLIGYLSHVRGRLAESLRTIREMAHRDALTGSFNRHHLVDTLEREIGRCERGADPFLLLIVDIDHFKRINDTHGHLVGDQALRAVAKELQAMLRQADYMARYGGEEFVVIASVSDMAGARTTCERIRRHIAGASIPALSGAPLTVSIGGSFHVRGDTADTVLARADAALYRAKNCGRNRFEFETANTAASDGPGLASTDVASGAELRSSPPPASS